MVLTLPQRLKWIIAQRDSRGEKSFVDGSFSTDRTALNKYKK